MRYSPIIFFILCALSLQTTSFAHVKFGADERTIIRLQDERRGIDTIEHFLNSKEEKVTWRAAIALANIADTSARSALIHQLNQDIRPKALEGIEFALGVLGPDKRSYDALLKVIPREPSDELFIALARAVPKDQLEGFAGTLNDSKTAPMHAANALVELGVRKILTESLAKKVEELERSDNAEIRWRAIYAFTRTDDSALLNNHLQTIKDFLADLGSPECRMFAATALGKIHNEAAGKILIDAGRSETQWQVRVNILNAMKKLPRFSSAMYNIIKTAVSESLPDSSVQNQIARVALDLLDDMITSGKLSSPDSVTVHEWLQEFPLTKEIHADISSLIGSQAMIPLARFGDHDISTINDITRYLNFQHRTVVKNASMALGLIADTLAVQEIVTKAFVNQRSEAVHQINALHSFWEMTKTDSIFRKQMDRRHFRSLYRNLLLRFGTLTNDAGVIGTTMEYLQDSLIIPDSLHKEAESYMLQYLENFSSQVNRDQLISLLGMIQWLKPKNDTFTTKMLAVQAKAASEWGDQGVVDSVAKTLRILHPGQQFKTPVARMIRDSINWTLLERMPDTLIVQSKYDFLYIRLNAYDAPLSALNIVKLSKMSFFIGSIAHRVVPNFVMQLGDPTGTGEGGPGYTIRTEIAPIRYDATGVCGMASSGKDTEGSQWFITHCPTPHLNTRYTIWGNVVIGTERIKLFDMNDQIDNLILHR
jgi:cyclophilin family peptidyl-prolyl cis-trans isomerase/HEAT repeat protein